MAKENCPPTPALAAAPPHPLNSDPYVLQGRTVRCARAVPALCEKSAVFHHG